MASKLPPNFPVIYGNFEDLPVKVQDFVADKIHLCQPDNLHVCDGSKEENEGLIKELMDAGIATPLHKHEWQLSTTSQDQSSEKGPVHTS